MKTFDDAMWYFRKDKIVRMRFEIVEMPRNDGLDITVTNANVALNFYDMEQPECVEMIQSIQKDSIYHGPSKPVDYSVMCGTFMYWTLVGKDKTYFIGINALGFTLSFDHFNDVSPNNAFHNQKLTNAIIALLKSVNFHKTGKYLNDQRKQNLITLDYPPDQPL